MKRTATLFAALCVILLGVNAYAAELPETVGRDCIAITALYAETGQFLDCVRMNVPSGERVPDAATFDNMPSGAYTTTFLLDSATLAPIPTAPPTPQPVTDTAYALLYNDGTLVFQSTATPDAARGNVTNTYEVDLQGSYKWDDDNECSTTPWYNDRESITTVDFADTIAPVSTAYWFYDCYLLTKINNINRLDTSNVAEMSWMFDMCAGLTELDVSNFDTSNVMDMSGMFDVCTGLTELDLSGFNTSNVTNMTSMFNNCDGLTVLDLSGWDTSNVKYMSHIFGWCSGLTTLDLSGFDTSNVIDMRAMFYNCSGLTALDLSNFDTSNVKYMDGMFYNCSGLTVLDVSGWDTSNVTNMSGMFRSCTGLTTIYVSDKFMTNAVENSYDMFYDDTSLIGGSGTVYDANHTDAEYARIDNPPSAPGYFTRKS